MALLGNNIFVMVGEGAEAQIIAGTRGNELRTSTDKIPISSPKTGRWKQHIAGVNDWSLSTNFLLLNASSTWRTALRLGQKVHLQFVNRTSGGIVVEMEGDALIEECTINAQESNLAYGSFTFAADGELYENVPVSGLTLSDDEITLPEGTTETIVATIAPNDATNKRVTWQSSDESIATVDDEGNVTAVGEGSCTITCTSVADSSISATCSVNVLPPVSVDSVSISPSTIETYVGGSVQLEATVLPSDAADKRVTWQSSDESIATVDDEGNVTAVAQGNCTITCTSVADNTKTATASITVTAFVPVESITLSGGEHVYLYLPGGDNLHPNYYNMNVYISPANASNKNVRIAIGPEGVVTQTKTGENTYRLSAIGLGGALVVAYSSDDSVMSNEVEVVVTQGPN